LQARGRLTAKMLAKELQVSERTVYRDIDALSAAGVPIYSEAGPEGGFALLENYRTTLTGLTDGEVRALFMLSVPAPLAELGVSRELRSALRKLSAALPAARRPAEERVRQRFYLDSTWWDAGDLSAPHLQTVHQAVWQDRKLRLTYRPLPMLALEQIAEPYSLVAKAGVWYVVCASNGRMRVHRVSDLLDAHLLDEHFGRQPDFDLAAFWQAWCLEQEQNRAVYPVVVRVAPEFVQALSMYLGAAIRAKLEQAQADAAGWLVLELEFASLEAARDRLLGFGRGAQVIKPQALRQSVLDYAEQIVALYTSQAV
jgi:predicted DNA-binding transcriptional regulator YafY